MIHTSSQSSDLKNSLITSSPATQPEPHRRFQITEAGWLLLITMTVYAASCVYLVYGLHYYAGDAQSRVANAYYVLFSRMPHLGAIGFVWNPLPSMLELPIVALHPWFPAVVARGLAGSVVSIVLGIVAVYHLHRIIRGMSINKYLRIVLTLCFALNPLIVLYGANGMSDIMWVACLLGTYSGVLDYLKTNSLRRLVMGGLWLAAGLGMRYEAVPFGAFVILALILAQWGKVSIAKMRGSAIILGAPIVFGGGVWIYFNWTIMKDPLYFLNSSYGNLAQTATGAYMTPAMAHAYHHIIGTLLYVGRFGLFYWPLYFAFFIALWYCFGKRRDARAMVLVAGTLGAELLEIVFAYQGHLGEWDRYFLEFIPNGILLTALATEKLLGTRIRSKVISAIVGIGLTAIFISGTVGTVHAVQNPVLGSPDGSVLDHAFHRQSMFYNNGDPYFGTTPLVRYINTHPKLTILADTFTDWSIIVRAHHLNQFIIPSDYNFSSVLHNPRGRVDAILVPQPSGVAQLNAINRAWPGLWQGRVPWLHLIKSFPGVDNWKLYQVLPTAP